MEENGELLFKNTSRLNEEEISIFQSYALKKITIWSSVLFTLAFVGIGVGLCFVTLYLGVALILAGVIGGCVLMPYLMKDSVKKQNKLMLGDRKYLNHFEFFNDYILVTTETTSSLESNDYQEKAKEKVYYSDLYQVVVFRTYIFIYLSKAQSLVLDQRGMTEGVVEDLLPFLKEKGLKIINKVGKVDESKIVYKKR